MSLLLFERNLQQQQQEQKNKNNFYKFYAAIIEWKFNEKKTTTTNTEEWKETKFCDSQTVYSVTTVTKATTIRRKVKYNYGN